MADLVEGEDGQNVTAARWVRQDPDLDTGTARRVPDSLRGNPSGRSTLRHAPRPVKRAAQELRLCCRLPMPEPRRVRWGRSGGTGAQRRRAALPAVLAALLLGLVAAAALADEPRTVWRVGTSGDYA